jgi:hypothetical protein
MWQTIKKVVRDCCTENNGTSYCPFRVTGFTFGSLACPAFNLCALWTTLQTGHFDYMSFGAGFASMMGGLALLAAGVAMKARTDT